MPTHFGGGRIMSTTEAVRNSAWTILVALDGAGAARGQLFLDDGVSIGNVETGRYAMVCNHALQ